MITTASNKAREGAGGFRAPIHEQRAENAQKAPLQGLQSGFWPSQAPILFVHGLFSTGRRSLDQLRSRLAILGHETRDFDWGPMGPIAAWLRETDIARRLLEHVEDGWHVIAHSRGCNLTREAMCLGGCFDQVFFFAPALPTTAGFPEHGARRIEVLHHPKDHVLSLGSRVFGWTGIGEMGRVGYQGSDPRVVNHMGVTPSLIHGDYFEEGHINQWAGYIHRQLSILPPYEPPYPY